MARPFCAPNRIAALTILFLLIIGVSFLSSSSHRRAGKTAIQKLTKSAQSAANDICSDHLVTGKPTISDNFFRLYEAIRYPIQSPLYKDAYGKIFEIKEDTPTWLEPLRKEILIVDIDTRMPEKRNELWNEGRMNWDELSEEAGGIRSASFMNHYLYSQIHGYSYRFVNAREMKGMHNTWIKPHVLHSLLSSYRFVVFLDADTTIQHLELPLEWLFNRWGITPQTSIAMPLDIEHQLGGDKHASEDSRGYRQLNTGFIVAQSLPHTFAMLEAWKNCPNESQYPGCGKWKDKWSHEQRAFSEYIRYDYNHNKTNIVEIPCDDAMGYPGLDDVKWVKGKCEGQFVRHHTVAKGRTKKSAEQAMLQAMTDLTRKALLGGRAGYWSRDEWRDDL